MTGGGKELQAYLNSLPEWNSASRISSLFSDFSMSKELNRVGYEANVNFWKKVLVESSKRGLLPSRDRNTGYDVLCLNVDGLEEVFKKNGDTPMGLEEVVAEMNDSGELTPITVFTGGQDGWGSWLVDTLLTSPLLWGLQKLSLSDNSKSKGSKTKYVLMHLLKEAGDKASRLQAESSTFGVTDCLMSFQEFQDKFEGNIFEGVQLSEDDIHVLIRYLEKNRKAVAIRYKTTENSPPQLHDMVIKFVHSNSQKVQITESDLGIVQIKETRTAIEKQISDIQSRILQLTEKAKEYLSREQKTSALSCLRQRKQLNQVLEKRSASFETMDSILLKIQTAESDAEIYKAYDVGANTLKSVMASTGLTVESIDETIDKLQDVMADQEEIEQAMVSGMESIQGAPLGLGEEEMGELESELDLLLEQENQEQAQQVVNDLPDVPAEPLPEQKASPVDAAEPEPEPESEASHKEALLEAS
ncbi:hypothetical protein K493DRAFT_405919 [Basidiobolus meristosporus CBS 931.73]|uniref:Snf7-domain-containing protein n=1 Tax=Basidiobolus meristosporus CBS 931.73 TaxID=1314790 RepID=A0A1Y1YQX7_9FUNG|nr:hypothetical protein K493DRAFT_405919 [Basidiobolus meristosporus CBS 931.73]|eukprot:ORY00432.1 hypothetical protein K493DRAFT_405919 [Basidiobolus meristosporus CBS 931.73]